MKVGLKPVRLRKGRIASCWCHRPHKCDRPPGSPGRGRSSGRRPASGSPPSPPGPAARKLLGWRKIFKLAHAFRWEYSYRTLKLAQLLGQLGVFLTKTAQRARWLSDPRPAVGLSLLCPSSPSLLLTPPPCPASHLPVSVSPSLRLSVSLLARSLLSAPASSLRGPRPGMPIV